MHWTRRVPQTLNGRRVPVKQSLVDTPANDRAPRFSPDGRLLAYVSGVSGQDEIYVRPFSGPGLTAQVSIDGGIEPVWSPDGRELFYRTLDRSARNALMVVQIDSDPAIPLGPPEEMFAGRYNRWTTQVGTANYDIVPDSERFLMVGPAEPSTTLNVVSNWRTELNRLVPVD